MDRSKEKERERLSDRLLYSTGLGVTEVKESFVPAFPISANIWNNIESGAHVKSLAPLIVLRARHRSTLHEPITSVDPLLLPPLLSLSIDSLAANN